MDIRQAIPADNEELTVLQARCQSGTGLVITTVNIPDFFARAKAYETCQVYVACQDGQIVGSAACAIRQAPVQGKMQAVGYEFQYFTSPDHRRTGVASRLHEQIEGGSGPVEMGPDQCIVVRLLPGVRHLLASKFRGGNAADRKKVPARTKKLSFPGDRTIVGDGLDFMYARVQPLGLFAFQFPAGLNPRARCSFPEE